MNERGRPMGAAPESPGQATTHRVIYGVPFGQAPTPFTYHDIVDRARMREYLEGMTRTAACLDCPQSLTTPESGARHAERSGHAVRVAVTSSSVIGSFDALCRVVV